MKTSMLLILFVCSASSKLYTPEQQVFMRNIIKTCQDTTSISTPMLKDFMKRKFSNDDVVKQFLFCFYKGLGIMKEDGSVDKEGFKKLGESFKYGAKTAANICLDKRGANGPETAFAIGKCFIEELPDGGDAGGIL